MEDVFTAIRHGQGQIYAAAISRTPARENQYWFGPAYDHVQQQVVCGQSYDIKASEDLKLLDLQVTAHSSYVETLERVQEVVPELNWQVIKNQSTEDVIEEIWSDGKGCNRGFEYCEDASALLSRAQNCLHICSQRRLAWIVDEEPGAIEKTSESLV